ncbi:putative sterigmatocystin biosynthesis monooxygenase stcW [Cyphellophora attinorum]|uniref:Putative sterigmatocystin biosynthesis monooxygenase stcW n=1 Tax=Cyphellophora attinorum TaxID=1664694 RepID=A0A0N1H2Z8_9EURO|nr:putative sterigmatocystin biosynthesis monooxygenase stcW [Phialophora attinorum]KPI35782.1 putative sterigmatocystin biosynthesis monooxygenase stcW [Phialophora attinorum]
MAPSAVSIEACEPILPTKTYLSKMNGIKSAVNGSVKEVAAYLDDTYTITEQPIGTRRPIRVACLGAGYSGLMMAIIFSQKMQNKNAELVIYERNADIGGTWLENRYPGCKCDIPAHNYAYSFAPKEDWPNYYATSQQIHGYMHEVAAKYDCMKYVKLQHSIQGARWNESKSKWDLTVKGSDGSSFPDEVDVFINAGGVLNNWKWPNIKGISDYKGALLHSAKWDESYDFTGKKVAVIGIGSSGIQIVPQLAKVVGAMDCYVKSRTWISPAPGINEPTDQDPEMDSDYNFTAATLELFKDPEILRSYRAAIMDRRIDNFKRAMADSDLQKKAQEMFRKSMLERLGDTEKGRRAAELLLPDFPVGCRRQTPGPGFLEALGKDNVNLHWDDIDGITDKGIRSRSGEERDYDVIVCATGFDTTFKPAFPLVGRNGVNLAERWEADRPKAYFGIAVPDMPNYFCFVGPNSPISNGSLVMGIQNTAIYIYKWLEKLQTESLSSFAVHQDVNEEYNQHIQRTIDGPVVAIYGGTTFHFMEALKNPRWEDFDLKRQPEAKSNRFEYLGNGFTWRETKSQSVGATQTVNLDDYWNLFVLPQIHD